MRIICCRFGTKFTDWHVKNLKHMIDNYSGLSYDSFEVIENDIYGNWYNKLQMYDKFRDGENLYFDLDVIIYNKLPNLVRKELFSVFNSVDLIIHAGDIGDQNVLIELESLAPVKAVLGNNDWQLPVKYKEKLTFNLCKKTIFIQHIFNDLPKEKKKDSDLIKNIISIIKRVSKNRTT